MASFKTFEQELTLEINQKVEIHATLEIGSQNDKVTVTAEAPPIQTEDSSVGLVIDSATIVNTPLNGRLNITGLMALAPGIQNPGSQDSIPVFGITPSVGGASAVRLRRLHHRRRHQHQRVPPARLRRVPPARWHP